MTKTNALPMRIFTTSVIVIVTAVAIAGLALSGSPQAERMRRLDTQRVNDLQQMSYAIDTYWSMQQRLPTNLDELQGTRDVYVQNIRDPKTGMPYEYTVTSADSYELCAQFETSSLENPDASNLSIAVPAPPRQDMQGRFWSHAVGRTCFPLTVRKPPTALK